MKTKKKKTMTRKQKRTLFICGMLALPLLQWLVFFVYVNINSVLMAFQSINLTTGEMEWTFDNFRRFINEWNTLPSFKIAVKNSAYAGINSLIMTTLSLTLSYFFYKKVPGRNLFRIIYFLPNIISIVVYTMVYKFMFDTSVGPINILLSKLGVAGSDLPMWFGDRNIAYFLVLAYCMWVGVGSNILVMGAAMENLSEDVMEYSRLEGVGKMRELFQIVAPMIWPTLSVSLLGSITVMFTLFIQVELLTEGGPAGSSATIAYLVNGVIRSANANLEWGAGMGFCFTLIAIPIIVIVKKVLDKIGQKFGW